MIDLLQIKYSGTSLLWTFLDLEFLVIFRCNMFSSFRGKKCTEQTKIFVLIMEAFYCVLNSASLSRGVPL